MKNIKVVSIIVLAVALLATGTYAVASSNKAPGVLPPKSVVGGLAYG